MTYQILLYYKFVQLADPVAVMKWQKILCVSLGLTGRIIVAKEGINGTVEGPVEKIKQYIKETKSYEPFADIKFKKSSGTGQAFPKLSVKARGEIVTLKIPEQERWDPATYTGKFLSPEQLHNWIHKEKKEFYIVDLRNDYEFQSGHFARSVLPPMKNFRDLPEVLPQLEHLKDKTIVTVCTGGIRCEKATGFLMKHGFIDLWQLKDGIVSYMEKYPNEDFLGKLYVFDNRYTMGFNTEKDEHKPIGRCIITGQPSENYVDFIDPKSGKRVHAIVSQKAIEQGLVVLD